MKASLNIFKKVYALLDSSPKLVLSVHFGSEALHLALFSHGAEGWRLIDYKIQALKTPFEPASHAEDIRGFLRSYGSATAGMVVTWNADFIEKPVVLPEMPPAEIEAAVRFAMEHHFSVQLDDCLFASMPSVEIASAHGMKTHQYFVFAAPKKEAKRYLDLMSALPVVPLSIVPSSIAGAELLALPAAEKDTGILEIGADGASFQIFRKGKPLVSRTIAVGLKAFAPAIFGAAKREGSAEPGSAEGSQGLDPDIVQKVRPQLERLIAGLQSSIDFYHQQNFSAEIEKIHLVEDGASLSDMPRLLEESIEIPVSRPSLEQMGALAPAALAAAELKERWIELLPAIGAFAVWKNHGMNLLPADIRFRAESQAKTKWLRFGAFGLTVLCLLFVAYAFVSSGLQKQQLEVLRIEEKSALDLKQLSQKSTAASSFRSLVQRGELPIVALMKLLSQETPTGVLIYDISFDRESRKVELNGGALASAGDPVGLSARLVKALASSALFVRAELVEGSQDPRSNAYKFKISAVTHEFV